MKAQNTTNKPAAQTTAGTYEVSTITAGMAECIRDITAVVNKFYELVEADAVRDIKPNSDIYESAITEAEKRMERVQEKSTALQEEMLTLLNRRTAETLRFMLTADKQAHVER